MVEFARGSQLSNSSLIIACFFTSGDPDLLPSQLFIALKKDIFRFSMVRVY